MDVLNLEWTSYPSRDRNMATLVCNYLRYMGVTVKESSVFCGFEMIDKLKPGLLFITNAVGAPINFQLVKYAAFKGIKVVTLTSEGNFFDRTLSFYIWGWNVDRKMYEDINMQWSMRTKLLTIEAYPELNDKVKVSGGVGFDYYRIVTPVKKNDFLNRYKKGQYVKVIGFGCWNFGATCPADSFYADFVKVIGESGVDRFRQDRELLNAILLKIIKGNPSILFLLKEHPGNTLGPYMSAIEGCERYPNVLILKKESIVDCIAVSDFWITYESTTVLEAWLLGKQTCLLNPTGIDFPRANVYRGSPNYPDVPTLQAAIDTFYSTHKLPGFHAMKSEREEVIRETIQWDDGLNHVRVGNEIIRVLRRGEKRKKERIPISLREIKWTQYLLSRGLPRKKNNFIYNRLGEFDCEELSRRDREIYNQQITYYKRMGLSKDDLQSIIAI